MNTHETIKNQQGSTLIEAIIAIAILTIGIFAAMTMQLNAISSSSSALNRTDANNVATSLLETLRELDFDDANLVQTSSNLVQDNDDRTFTAAAFPEIQSLIQIPTGAAAGTIIDQAGITYQLSWDVQNVSLAGGATLQKIIRVYMTWNSLKGQNHLEMSTIKYNNISL